MKNSRKLLFGVIVVAGSLGFYACSRNSQKTASNSPNSSDTSATGSANRVSLPSSDADFVQKAAIGGMAEVEMGNLANQRAASDDVKQFGQRMVQDHTKINQDLQRLASSKGVTLPSALDDKHRNTVDRLSKLNGKDFDREYMHEMVRDHKEDVAEFQREAESAQDPDVKAFATNYLPTLQDHLRMAEEIEKKVSK
jgi:putative membrane protein